MHDKMIMELEVEGQKMSIKDYYNLSYVKLMR